MTESETVLVEVGKCLACGKVEGPFPRDNGPRCPRCRGELTNVHNKQIAKAETIFSDVHAEDLLDEIH